MQNYWTSKSIWSFPMPLVKMRRIVLNVFRTHFCSNGALCILVGIPGVQCNINKLSIACKSSNTTRIWNAYYKVAGLISHFPGSTAYDFKAVFLWENVYSIALCVCKIAFKGNYKYFSLKTSTWLDPSSTLHSYSSHVKVCPQWQCSTSFSL